MTWQSHTLAKTTEIASLPLRLRSGLRPLRALAHRNDTYLVFLLAIGYLAIGCFRRGASATSDVAILKRSYILTTASGFLLAIPFIYPSFGFLAWVGLVPLFFAIRNSDLKHAALAGLVFGMVFFATSLYWMQVFGFLAWGSLSLLLTIWDVFFAVGLWLVLKNYRGAGQYFLVPSLWALSEFGRSLGPWGFSWANLGLTVNDLHILKIASYSGELGLGFIIVLVNLIIFRVLIGKGLRTRLRDFGVGAVVIAVVVLIWPVVGLAIPDKAKSSVADTIKVAVVQPDIAQEIKLDVSNNEKIKTCYMEMTRGALRLRPDLIVWPENILASYLNDEEIYLKGLQLLLAQSKTPIILGGLNYIDGGTYNCAFYINSIGVWQEYRKIHLVPFGEYMPMRSIVEHLNSMANLVIDIKPGSRYKVFDIGKGTKGQKDKFSTIICFESSDSALVGKMVKNGARMLVVITNDGWFGRTAALEQHFRIARMRAVEYGVPVIQGANTGISGIIDSSGKVVAKAGIEKQQLVYGSITFVPKPSFFARFGYLIIYLYFAAVVIGLIYRIFTLRIMQLNFTHIN